MYEYKKHPTTNKANNNLYRHASDLINVIAARFCTSVNLANPNKLYRRLKRQV